MVNSDVPPHLEDTMGLRIYFIEKATRKFMGPRAQHWLNHQQLRVGISPDQEEIDAKEMAALIRLIEEEAVMTIGKVLTRELVADLKRLWKDHGGPGKLGVSRKAGSPNGHGSGPAIDPVTTNGATSLGEGSCPACAEDRDPRHRFCPWCGVDLV